MKTISIKLYSFKELNAEAQEKAIEDHREFLLSVMSPDDYISGDAQYDTAEELQKAYEADYNYYLENDETIVESIEANEYLFLHNGKLVNASDFEIRDNEIYD